MLREREGEPFVTCPGARFGSQIWCDENGEYGVGGQVARSQFFFQAFEASDDLGNPTGSGHADQTLLLVHLTRKSISTRHSEVRPDRNLNPILSFRTVRLTLSLEYRRGHNVGG